jgi:hypothetical protein
VSCNVLVSLLGAGLAQGFELFWGFSWALHYMGKWLQMPVLCPQHRVSVPDSGSVLGGWMDGCSQRLHTSSVGRGHPS